ncbi:UNVERIFIED_CONTAM: hypothetical protein Sradi_3065000 [Sesamum radiatum]|uniref:Uncharacterized protein n=1 Tax=Sesamum radiatum TaxID=300843 RepID=A0AAW2RBE7_SESRA
MFSDGVGIEKGRRYYTIVNKGFKLLIDNNDLRREWKKVLKDREMSIYVECILGEGAGEEDAVGEGLKRKMLWGEGDAVSEGVGENDAVNEGTGENGCEGVVGAVWGLVLNSHFWVKGVMIYWLIVIVR